MSDNLIALKFADGTEVLVEATGTPPVAARQQLASGGLPLPRLEGDFSALTATIRNIAEEVKSAVSGAIPSSTELEFGLDINVDTGVLLAQLVKGGAKASLRITLRWE